MNRVLLSLCVSLTLASCRTAPVGPVQVVGPRIANLQADLEQAFETVPRAGARVGYDWHELRRERLQIVMRTPPEQVFFTLLGEQVRFEEATVRLREQAEGVEIQVDATLVHGPPGGPYERKERVGQDWYDNFFVAVAAEMELPSLEDDDAPAVEP